MSTAWRWLSRLLMVLLVPVAVLAAIWAYGRLTAPTAAQEAAIAVMQQDAPGEGENGFSALMALAPLSTPFPEVLNCGNPTTAPCFTTIEAAPEASAAAIEPFRASLEAAAGALHAPVFRDRRDAATMGKDELPPFQAVTQIASLRALDFAAGDTAGALASACEDALGATRWAVEPDSLLQGMIGIAVFRKSVALIGDMRQRAPGDALPASCEALARASDAATEGSLCNALRGEWRYQRRMFASLEGAMTRRDENPWDERLTPLMHDTGWTLGQSARAFAAACDDAAKQAAREDRPVRIVAAEPRWVDYVAFPTSVLLADIAMPAYEDYGDRQLDFVAQRRLLAAFLQMDAMGATLTPAQRFEALPEALRGGPRPLRFDAATGRLGVPLRGRRDGDGDNEAVLAVGAMSTGA